MGSVEQEIKDVSEVPTDLPTVINDFDEVIIRFFFSKYFLFLYVCTYAFMYFVKSKFVLIISCQDVFLKGVFSKPSRSRMVAPVFCF